MVVEPWPKFDPIKGPDPNLAPDAVVNEGTFLSLEVVEPCCPELATKNVFGIWLKFGANPVKVKPGIAALKLDPREAGSTPSGDPKFNPDTCRT